jgi:NAD(P)-dependent dehydrogenase (short-subunit alcohol dehydrogenase family)
LSARGDHVIAVCRQASRELNSLGVQIEAGIELTEASALDELISRLQSLCLDGVILNAGILHSNALNNLDVEAIRQQFEINALAPLRLVSALTCNLSSGSWIALMTSRMGSIADNSSGGSYGYRMSKAALNIAGKSLAIDLKPQGIAVVILHPGLVSTRMINFNPSGISPQQSVEGLLKRIDALTLETSGSFWHANGDLLPW